MHTEAVYKVEEGHELILSISAHEGRHIDGSSTQLARNEQQQQQQQHYRQQQQHAWHVLVGMGRGKEQSEQDQTQEGKMEPVGGSEAAVGSGGESSSGAGAGMGAGMGSADGELDDITTQGLLDGLEDLYEQVCGPKESEKVESSDKHEEMDGEVAAQIVQQFGGFSGARSTMKKGSSAVPAKAEAELDDMSDSEAQHIVGALGGFQRPRAQAKTPAQTPAQTLAQTPAQTPVHTPVQTPAPRRTAAGLSVGRQATQRGGLAASATPARAKGPMAAAAASEPSPTTAVAATTAPATPAMATGGLFPSRQDVRSARRALMGDSGGRVARRLTFGARSSANSNADAGADAAASPAKAGALTFRQPGLKRPGMRAAFTPPAKRTATGQGQGLGSAATTPVLARSRPPPKLPPVTVRTRAPAPVLVPAPHHQNQQQQQQPGRLRLADIADEVATTEAEAVQHGVPADALAMTATAAASYRFGSGAAAWGWGEARQALLARGCSAAGVTEAWVRNHFRWSVWTAASYARRLPGRWRALWSAEAVTERLLRRYEREHVRGERPALRRVLEGDAAAQQLMVLAVAAVCGGGDGDDVRVEVTDGWYGVAATVDAVLAQAVRQGRLRAGDKIACVGQQLRGARGGGGVAALSDEAGGVSLALTANGVRRARWDARLGFRRGARMFMAVSAVHVLGGSVAAALDVVVVRRYAAAFRETLGDGSRVVRCEREELRAQDAFVQRRAALAASLQAEGVSLEGGGEGGSECDEQRMLQLQQRVEAAVPARQVCAYFRLLVCDYPAHGSPAPASAAAAAADAAPATALVTVWAPRGMCPADFGEGRRFLLTGLAPAPHQRPGAVPLRLNFSASGCAARPMAADAALLDRTPYTARAALHVDELRHVAACQEVDVVGAVDAVEHAARSVLRVVTVDEHALEHTARIEFDAATFGRLAPPAGTRVTVRSCVLLAPSHTAPRTFLLRADEHSEIVFEGAN